MSSSEVPEKGSDLDIMNTSSIEANDVKHGSGDTEM